jgi:hypothetical protein
VFYGVVSQGGRYQNAIAAALLTATVFVCLALLVAVLELRAHPRAALADSDEAAVVQADLQ